MKTTLTTEIELLNNPTALRLAEKGLARFVRQHFTQTRQMQDADMWLKRIRIIRQLRKTWTLSTEHGTCQMYYKEKSETDVVSDARILFDPRCYDRKRWIDAVRRKIRYNLQCAR